VTAPTAHAAGIVLTGPDATALPEVKAFAIPGATTTADFPGYHPSHTSGVRVAARDLNGDGTPDYIHAPGSGQAPNVRVYSGAGGALIQSYDAFAPAFTGGVFVGAGGGRAVAV
jgi:hypothetical protein